MRERFGARGGWKRWTGRGERRMKRKAEGDGRLETEDKGGGGGRGQERGAISK